jgi:hypothetical protein
MFFPVLPALHLALHLAPELTAHLVSAQRLEERRGQRSSGLAALDRLLSGGWPKAALSELMGRRSSGRTSALFSTLARATAAGETTALVDAEGTLDPRAAAAAGIALPRLLWIRCAPDQALKATDMILGAGGFDIVALDLGDTRPRVPTASWVRLKHGAEKQGTSVLVATPARAVGAFAAAAVEFSGAAPRFVPDGPPLFGGLRAKVERGRGTRGGGARDQRDEREADPEDTPSCAWLAFSCRS